MVGNEELDGRWDQTGCRRPDFEKWQGDMKEKSAERAARNAEEDAVDRRDHPRGVLPRRGGVGRHPCGTQPHGEADQLAARS